MRILLFLAPAFLVVLALIGQPERAQAATFTVLNANDSGAGSFRQAISDANGAAGPDAIVFDGTFFATPRTITLLSNLPVIFTDITITGPGVNNLTVSAAGCAGCNVLVNNGTLTASGMTLTGASNGAMVSTGTSILNNFVITGNTVGGGIQVLGGNTSVVDSTISNNSSTGNGGGVRHQAGIFQMTRSTVSGNTAAGDGGGLYFNANFGITDSTISGNTAARGGGIFRNSTGGTPVGRGIFGTTLINNVATALNGGGQFTFGVPVAGTVWFANTIIAQGASGSVPACVAVAGGSGIPTSFGNNIASDGSCASFLIDPSDQQNTDPVLGPLANNGGPTLTHLPLAGSPAIDNGNASIIFCAATDQRGLPRPADGDGNGAPVCDIGAVEVQAALVTPPVTLPTANATATSTPVPVVVAPAPVVIPQVFQNPGAAAAIMGGIGNGTRNNTPVPSQQRPAAVLSSSFDPVMPVLRPPSTGDAGLLVIASGD